MQTQWSAWLAAEKAAGRGGDIYPEAIVRGLAFSMLLPIPLDVSADGFKASLRLSPDAPGAALADFTVALGSFADGVTPITLSLTAAQTGGAALAGDGDGDGLAEMVFELLHIPAGGAAQRANAMVLLVSGRVTEPAA